MSYPGPQQQFGLSDLQLLQQQLMLAQLQELQTQQQFGQIGDGKPSSSYNSMPLYAKHAASGQIPSQGRGAPFNASYMVSSNNLNWMHHNLSSSMQGVIRGSTYFPGEGLMMNSALQQPHNSFYGTPVASGLGNSRQYSPMQGVPHSSVYALSVNSNSNEKPISTVPAFGDPFMVKKLSVPPGQGHPIDESFTPRQGLQEKGLVDQSSDQMFNSGIFLLEQMKQRNDSRSTATLDPLEEKILFHTEDSGWDTSFTKLASLDTEEFVGASSHIVSMNACSSIQSGSWSALMQSAVGEASSSDTGIQEELSGLSFQNTDSAIGKQPSNQWMDKKTASSLNNLTAPLSSVDSMLINGPVPVGHSVDGWVGLNDKNSVDLSLGSRTSALSGMIRNDYELIQQAVGSHGYVPIHGDSDQKDYKSKGYDHQSSSNPMAVGALYKRAAEIYGNQNRCQGENSCDSYNSKLSQAYVAQADHASSNAEDSESSARSSHKSQNQALFVSSPGAYIQQESFSRLKSNNAFPSNADSMMKGKPNLSADAFSKGSPASDMSASFDSQNASEHNKASQSTDHRSIIHIGFNISQTESREHDLPKISVCQGPAILDKFSFQSSEPGDSRLSSLENRQKGQTWWMPSSFGHSVPPMHCASLLQSCSGKSNILEKTAIENSNLKIERNSLDALFSGHLNVDNQLDGRSFPETSQQKYVSGFSPTQNCYPLKKISSFGHEHTASGAFPVTQSMVIQGSHRQCVKPLNVWKDVPGLSSLNGISSRSLAIGKDSPDEQNAPILENVNLLTGDESAEKYPTISTDAIACAESFINQQGYINNGLQRKPSGLTLRALPTYHQSPLLHNVGSVKMQEDIGDTGLKKMDYISPALRNLNKQQVPDFPVWRSLHEMHQLDKINTGCRFDSCSSDDQMVPSEQSIPLSMLPSDTSVTLVSRPKKRKTAMYDCLPWHKVVVRTCQALPDISTAEQEWAEMTNRLTEMCVDEDERNGEMHRAVFAKRRLILTTKLMQMVFLPPPPEILSVNASAEYEIVAYFSTKLALADACSLANKSSTDCNTSHEFGSMNRYGKMADHLSHIASELFQRTRELESHIDSLSKSNSIVDVLVECQELDKFGVINHFARYHSRVATDSASSSTGMISVKPFLQRYVSAVPLPLKLPEGVQCLSL